MTGVTTRSRLEELQALLTKTRQEIFCTARRGGNTTDLRELATRLEAAIAVEQTPAQFELFDKPTTDRVTMRLAELAVTSHEVKVWAHARGLVDAVKRGRIGWDLVEAYAAHHEGRARLLAQHGAGTCVECSDHLITATAWARATNEQRHLWRSWGCARKTGRGLCSRCWVRLDHRGDLDRHHLTRTPVGDNACTRCGIEGIADDLCVDCQDFLADEAEQEAS